MPKQTTEKKTCDRCKFSHPATWFKFFKLKDGTKKRSSHCKLCCETRGCLPKTETWVEQIYKERAFEKEISTKPESEGNVYRTIRFRYYGMNTDLWQDLRKTLLDKPSKSRSDFLEKWAGNAGLYRLERCESVIGTKISGKDLRIKDNHDSQDLNDIIVTNINSGHCLDDPYKWDWTNHELSEVIKAFKRSIPFEGTVTGSIEIHVE